MKPVEKLRPWILGLTVAGVLGVTAAILYQETHSNNTSEVSVKPAPVAAVVALGRIAPEGEIIKLSVPNAQDSRVNQILVKEGDFLTLSQFKPGDSWFNQLACLASFHLQDRGYSVPKR